MNIIKKLLIKINWSLFGKGKFFNFPNKAVQSMNKLIMGKEKTLNVYLEIK